ILREDEVARRERLDGNLARESLVGFDAVLDEDPSDPTLQELVDGEAPPALRHGHDDPAGADVVNDLRKPCEGAIKRVASDRALRTCAVIDHAHDRVPGVGTSLDSLGEFAGEWASPENQHTLDEMAASHHRIRDSSERQEKSGDDEEARDERPARE